MIFSDPSLLISNTDRKMLPLILDLFLHGANFILNFIEHVFVFPKSDSRAMGIVFYFVFSIFYACFMKFLYHCANLYFFGCQFMRDSFAIKVVIKQQLIKIAIKT